MAYQVYFADLSEENRGLTMMLLRLKEEAGAIEPDEAELLTELRGSPTPWPAIADEPAPRQHFNRSGGGRRGPRRGPSNGRAYRMVEG